MAFAFDTLGYAKHLRDAGVPQMQAEGHAEAAREFIMAELVTRSDLEVTRRELDGAMERHGLATRADLEATRRELEGAIEGVRLDLAGTRRDLDGAIEGVRLALAGTRRDLEGAIERLEMRMTIRLGGMLAIAIAILAGIIKL